MPITAHCATERDIPLLVEMMEEFYGESSYPLDCEWATRSFAGLLESEAHGAAWIVYCDAMPAGYIVLTLHFNMEYGGLSGSIDDLFVRPAFRRRGVARVAIDVLLTQCKAHGLLAVQVETGTDNTAARTLYQSCGLQLRDDQRQTFTLRLPGSEAPSNTND